MAELIRSVFSSEVASLFGLTNKGLSFYEEKGLFSPQRSKGGNYRMYEPSHVSALYRCRLMRQFGLRVDDAVHMAREGSPDDYLHMLSASHSASEARIRRLRYELDEIERRGALIERVKRRDFSFVPSERPALCWAEVWDTTQHFPTTANQARCFQMWSSASIMTSLSIMLPRSRIDCDRPTQWHLSGFVAAEDVADFLELSLEPTMIKLAPTPCLYGIMRYEEGNFFPTRALEHPLACLREQGFSLCGDIVSRNIMTVMEEDHLVRYDEIWLPIDE